MRGLRSIDNAISVVCDVAGREMMRQLTAGGNADVLNKSRRLQESVQEVLAALKQERDDLIRRSLEYSAKQESKAKKPEVKKPGQAKVS